MTLAREREAPTDEVEAAHGRGDKPNPDALLEIYWPYLWGEAADADSAQTAVDVSGPNRLR